MKYLLCLTFPAALALSLSSCDRSSDAQTVNFSAMDAKHSPRNEDEIARAKLLVYTAATRKIQQERKLESLEKAGEVALATEQLREITAQLKAAEKDASPVLTSDEIGLERSKAALDYAKNKAETGFRTADSAAP